TGQLTVRSSRSATENHTHLTANLDGGRFQLRFRDVRRFGCAELVGDDAALEQFFVRSGLGPEPFDLDRQYWRHSLASTSRCLKAVLLDQRVVAGVGNIYADESLFWARLHPTRRGCDVTDREVGRLRR